MNLRRSEDANEEILQDRLRILLDRLQWSYINLWTLNPRTRLLEWKRGHFEVVSAKAGAREYAQLLYTTYKSCCFTPGVGAVGRAYLEGRHFWLTGDAASQHAGLVTSANQSQFLRYADIKTTIYIPCVDSVLEIGTSREVAENWVLADRIHQVTASDLLSVEVPVGPEPARFEPASKQTASGAAAGLTMFPGFDQDSGPLVDHSTNLALQSPASILQLPPLGTPLRDIPAGHLSLAEQVWRSANDLSLSLSSDYSEMQANSDTDMATENLAFGQEAEAPSSMHIQTQDDSRALASAKRSKMTKQAGLMSDRYWSLCSGAAASSTTELHQQHFNLANSSSKPRYSANDRTSTSGTFHSQLSGPRNHNQIRRSNSCGDQYEIQKCHTLSEAPETHEQWPQQPNPAPELAAKADATMTKTLATDLPAGQNLPFQGWQTDVGAPAAATLQTDPSMRPPTGMRSNVKIMNQVSKIAGSYLRKQSQSALELLKDIDKKQKEATEASSVPNNVKVVQVLQEPSKPAYVQINRPSQTYPSGERGTREVEVASNSDPSTGHAHAAVSHMLAERHRRTKQKENFKTLRRLVPIISKADKTSTLTDAITYLTFLQSKIQAMEASTEDMDHRCQILENRCKGLRDRNLELVGEISKDQPLDSAIHLNLVHLKLQALNSV